MLVLATSARAAPRAAVLCVAVEDPFVPPVPERAVVEAVRARVATQQLSVIACRNPAARTARWRLDVRRTEPGLVAIEARGEGVVLDESLPVEGGDGAEAARQVAITAAEMLRPTLIAWFDTTLAESPVAQADAPAVEAEAPVQIEQRQARSGTTTPQVVIGGETGARFGGRIAVHLGLLGQLRYHRWRFTIAGDGDRWTSTRLDDVTSRFAALEVGASVGRELVAKRLWLDVGGQLRFTRASLTGANDVLPRVSARDWGLRTALSAVIWRGGSVEVGVSGRLAWWHEPMRLFYESRELQRQAHIDLLVAPYFALVL